MLTADKKYTYFANHIVVTLIAKRIKPTPIMLQMLEEIGRIFHSLSHCSSSKFTISTFVDRFVFPNQHYTLFRAH